MRKLLMSGFRIPEGRFLLRQGVVIAGLVVAIGSSATAGMPQITLTDVARARLDSISFFGMGLLISAAGVRWLWNSLVRDLAGWPRLTYAKALGWTVLWGLLFLIVLTMISGARELLTPGAWKKTGLTYELNDAIAAPVDETRSEVNRHRGLETLRVVLWTDAATHGGAFPASKEKAGFARELWVQPGFPAVEYLYRAGLSAGKKSEPLVIEYDLYGDGQLALFSDGAIRRLTPSPEKPPEAEETPAGAAERPE